MAKTKSELVAAAIELDAELARFDDGVAAFKKLALTSKKNIDRAAKMLEKLAVSEQGMSAQIQALVAAIGAAREMQMGRVAAVKEKGEQLKTRALEFRDLIVQFEVLGVGAAGLNAKLQADKPEIVDVVQEVDALRAKAEALVAEAKQRSFDDVAHMADTLRQQLASLGGKLSGVAAGRG